MAYKLSAGVYPQEYVRGATPSSAVNMTIGASVFASKKGPLGRKLITGGWDKFVKIYGQPDMQWSPAHLALKPALKQMDVFYGYRVVNDAKYAGTSLFYDGVNKKFFALPFETGSSNDYENASRVSKVISFSDAIPNNKTISLDLGTSQITQVFNTTSNYTLQLLANQIQSKLDDLGTGGFASVIKTWNFSDRKMEVSLTFNRPFEVNDIVGFSIEGTPGIVKTVVTETFDGNNIKTPEALLAKIIEDLNAIDGLTAVLLPDDLLPAISIRCNNAGPVTLSIIPENNQTAGLTFDYIVEKEGHGVYDDRSIVITLPESLDSLEISGEVQDSTVKLEVEDNAKIMDIFAENPGAWASSQEEGLGIKITNLDLGIQQRTKLTLSQAITADNVFNCTISYNGNSWAIEPVTFDTSNDKTLKNIANAIQELLNTNVGEGGSVTVEEVTGGVENDREILIITPDASQSIEITDAVFTGGNSQPVVTIKQIIPNTPSKQTFTLQVFNRESLVNPIETYEAAFKPQLDISGNQMYITDRVNQGAYESDNIRVVVYNSDFTKLQNMSTIAWLGGGDDGYLPANNQIVSGWDAFADPEDITVRILINAGYADVNVHQKMAGIAAKRRDCVALLDMPSGSQKTEAAMNYRQYEMNVNTSYAALYSPDVLVFDEVSGTDVYIAPSGYAAAQICYTEKTRAIYWAPAGLNRGICEGAKGVRVKYSEGDRDLLEPLHINPIRDMKTNGIVIFGEYTTQTQTDPLSDLHTRLLCNSLEIQATDSLAYDLFEPNDEYIRSVMALKMETLLKPVKDGRGVRDYRIVSDITKENAADVDAGCGVVSIYIQPTSSLKFIRLNNYILGSAISFDEVIA